MFWLVAGGFSGAGGFLWYQGLTHYTCSSPFPYHRHRAATCKSNCWDNKCVWSDGDPPSGDALCDGVGDGDDDGEFCKEDADFAINQVETPRAKLAEGDLVESPASMDMTIRCV